MSTLHAKRAREFLKDPAKITHHDQTFWGMRMSRDKMVAQIPEWEELRDKASEIKRHTITHLADYLEEFSDHLEKNGVHVLWARDAKEFNQMVLKILTDHHVKKMVKSKSMMTEECGMNDFLKARGIDVVETDLGERILQLMHLKPAHIVVPAIHITRQQVAHTFEEKGMSHEEGNDDPTYLTRCARNSLRSEFLEAGAGMTGCNFGVAKTGDVVVCTNEGNADMATSMPKLHIVAMGLEKVIPDYASLAFFQRLLCRSATGQPTTTYTSHFRKPRPGGEMYVILIDNGRSDFIANPDHWETLKCIRCGACMNTCPVYRRSTGYSYSFFIPGPIGIDLGMLKDPKANSGNVSACSLCLSCDEVCPVHVNPGSQIYLWRQQLDHFGTANSEKKLMSWGMARVYNNYFMYDTALKMAPLLNHVPEAIIGNPKWSPWCVGHKMPVFVRKPFHVIEKDLEKEYGKESTTKL